MNRRKIIIFSVITLGVIGIASFLVVRNKKKSALANADNMVEDNGSNSFSSDTVQVSPTAIPPAAISAKATHKLMQNPKCLKYIPVWKKYKDKFVRYGVTVYRCFGDGLLVHYPLYSGSEKWDNGQIWNQALDLNADEIKCFYETSSRPNWTNSGATYLPSKQPMLASRSDGSNGNPGGIDNSRIQEIFECSKSLKIIAS